MRSFQGTLHYILILLYSSCHALDDSPETRGTGARSLQALVHAALMPSSFRKQAFAHLPCIGMPYQALKLLLLDSLQQFICLLSSVPFSMCLLQT